MVRRTTALKLDLTPPTQAKAVKGGQPLGPAKRSAASVRAQAAIPQDSLHTYRRVTDIIWQRLSPTFGMRTINAIARNVIAREATEFPLLRHLEVGDSGLGWDDLAKQARDVPPQDMHQAIEGFISLFFESLTDMIGQIVAGKLLSDAELVAREEEKP